MAKFGEMSADDRKELCTKIAQCLKDHDLADVPVTVYREEVAQLTEPDVVGKLVCKVEKSLPSTDGEKVENFKNAIKEIVGETQGVEIKVAAVIGAGDMYKTITNVTTLDSDAPVSIEHTQGEVLLIDFWATWCPPCQRPMQHNQDMLEANEGQWGDKVKIIGLSIDGDAATVKKHVENKKWLKPIHYWRSKSDCSDVYKVSGVPHVMLIDTQGKIVFKGHPANRPDLASDMTKLLAGETISGEGCAPAEAVAGADGAVAAALPEGHKASTDEEIAAIQEFMTNFKVTGKELQAECKEDATGMQRNFMVMVLSADLTPSTMTWSSKFENYRVLVGAQAKIDTIKEKISAKFPAEGALFTVNEQFHPTD